jgi:ABC-2 type transport system ATP-binding protein
MSSHILSEVEKVCERVGIIKEGSIVAMEDVDSLRKKSGKVMEVEFVTDITEKDLDIPEITQVSIDGHKAHFRAMGNMDTVIKHVSQYTIKDLTARELSVEDMFMHYYEGE